MLRQILRERLIKDGKSTKTQDVQVVPITPLSRKKELPSLKSSLEEKESLEVQAIKDWKIVVKNSDYVFGLTVDTVTNPTLYNFGNAYFLTQFTGQLNIEGDLLTSSSDGTRSGVVLTSIAPSKVVQGNSFLWQYGGIRQDYQYAQIKVNSKGEIYVLGSFTDSITYSNGKSYVTLSSQSKGITYQYFLAKMVPMFDTVKSSDTIWANVVWITRISATGLQDLQININKDPDSSGNYNDDVYLVGTYQGTIIFDPVPSFTPPTTTLPDDMFISRITSDGTILWTITSYKNASNPNVSSTGYIRATSVTVGPSSIVAIGSFNETFSTDASHTVKNYFIPFNMWIAKINFDGTVSWLISPTSNYNPDSTFATLTSAFVNGTQIVSGEIVSGTSTFYIAGTYQGSFTFADILDNESTNPDIFLVKLMDTQVVGGAPNWVWQKDIVSPVPKSILQVPHISYINNEVYINFFGTTTASFRTGGVPDVVLNMSGSLDDGINLISSGGVWGNAPGYIAGVGYNLSVNTAPGPSSDTSNPIYLVGTHTMGLYTSEAYLIQI